MGLSGGVVCVCVCVGGWGGGSRSSPAYWQRGSASSSSGASPCCRALRYAALPATAVGATPHSVSNPPSSTVTVCRPSAVHRRTVEPSMVCPPSTVRRRGPAGPFGGTPVGFGPAGGPSHHSVPIRSALATKDGSVCRGSARGSEGWAAWRRPLAEPPDVSQTRWSAAGSFDRSHAVGRSMRCGGAPAPARSAIRRERAARSSCISAAVIFFFITEAGRSHNLGGMHSRH